MKLGVRLVLSYIGLVLVGMGIVTTLAWLAVEELYLGVQQANLLAQAEALAAGLSQQPLTSVEAQPYSQAMNITPGIHSRLLEPQSALVIDLNGQLMAAPATNQAYSDRGLELALLKTEGFTRALQQATPEELLGRPEVVEALSGSAATAVRRVDIDGGVRVLYAAAPLPTSGEYPAQVVYLATPLPDNRWSNLPLALRWEFAGVIASAAILSTLTGIVFSRRITRPISRLAIAAGAVAAGDLTQSVPEDNNISELASLSRAFNDMTTNLRQAEQGKTAFIAGVTHELRTPLTVIKGTVETLQDGAIDDLPARERFLDAMGKETERLIRLVNDLLVLTRADAGALNLQLEMIDLHTLAASRSERLQRMAGEQPVFIEVEAHQDMGKTNAHLVFADSDRMAQVFDNLLENAIRYSPPGGVVRITFKQENSMLVCQVSDQGIGIAAEHLPFIFDRFYRADPSRARSQDKFSGGSGLGLSIVRGLIVAHGGTVEASSVEGLGTMITFRLPQAASNLTL